MGKLIKWILILTVLAGIALSVYAYLGPFFGVDFSPKQTQVSIPVELNGQ